MKVKLFFGALNTIALLSASVMTAQNFQTMPVQSGYTADVIANGIGSSSLSTTTDVDGVSYAFVSKDFQLTSSSTPLTYGLPTDEIINSVISSTPLLSYRLGSYNGNNSLRLANTNDTGTLTFTTPKAAYKLYMLATSGSGASVVTVTVNFTDATSQTISGVNISDWYGGTDFAVQGFGRINRTTDALESGSGTNPRLYQILLNIDPANQNKSIQSVTVTKTSAGTPVPNGIVNVFAFSADAYSDCGAPILQPVGTVTANSADISWTVPTGTTAVSYDVYYSTTNTAPTSSTSPSFPGVTGTSMTIPSLSSNTTYYYWVRTNCSSATSQSLWSFAGTFKTLCGPMTYMFENFDSYATGNIVPDCWVRNFVNGTMSISSSSPASGTRNIYQNSSSSQTPSTVVLPEFSNINAGTNWLRLKARVSSATGTLNVGYVTNPTDPSTFVLLQALSVANTTYTATSEYMVVVPSSVPANARLAIKNTADGKSYYWDDVYWETIPTCFKPSNVTVSNVTNGSVMVSWTSPSPAPAEGFEIYYNTTNVTPTSATLPITTSSTTSVQLNNLGTDTNYYLWVRSKCSSTDKSVWTNVTPFRTGYCLPSSTSQNSWVSSFSSTGAVTNLAYASPSGIAGGYQNLTATNNKISNTEGSSTPISLTVGGGTTCGFAVWVDWNNNLTFEATERVHVTTGYVSSTSGIITVPAGTVAGNYRMRAVVDYTSSAPSIPCGALSRGEYVDLIFEVVSSLATSEVNANKQEVKVYPNPFEDVLYIENMKDVKSVAITDLAGRVVKTISNPTKELRLHELNAGLYLVTIYFNDGSKSTVKAIKQ
ncbi:fibronectin type III domain-containing protein [Chryseobacterium oryctis]|uniref:Fibronectin type III domain-containing protein n=1 Tax=Chryseobacterium oryctis TaxID=2952618 RepID=A0ABT3HJP9_9FLAO|nr:fibronectin type III domain-containing protein [Chryseobacterium oryctis]MCW3160025.1 fibronectin type III domain-containing protein [Chryseobacterium oryctis]